MGTMHLREGSVIVLFVSSLHLNINECVKCMMDILDCCGKNESPLGWQPHEGDVGREGAGC